MIHKIIVYEMYMYEFLYWKPYLSIYLMHLKKIHFDFKLLWRGGDVKKSIFLNIYKEKN